MQISSTYCICQGTWTYHMHLTRKLSEELCLFFVQSNAGNYTPRPISVQSGVWNQNSLFFISQKTVVDMQDGVSLHKGPEDSQ